MKRVNEGSVAGTLSGAQRHKGRDSCGGAAAQGECSKHLGNDNPGDRSYLVSKEPLVAVYGRLLLAYESKLAVSVDFWEPYGCKH